MTHIESRPSKVSDDQYEFYVDCLDCGGDKLKCLVEELKKRSLNVQVSSRSQNETDTRSFYLISLPC